jgi:hypothetical protein
LRDGKKRQGHGGHDQKQEDGNLLKLLFFTRPSVAFPYDAVEIHVVFHFTLILIPPAKIVVAEIAVEVPVMRRISLDDCTLNGAD